MNGTKYFLASLLIVLSGLFATFSNASAQCPPDKAGCVWGPWSNEIHTLMRLPDCEIVYKYRVRWCNGQMEIDYELVSAVSNCADGFSPSALKEFVELIIIQQRMEKSFEDNSLTIPDCDDIHPLTAKVVTFYTASCGIWLSCEYDIIPQVPECEQGLDAPPAGPTTVKTWTWKSCGTQCCKNVYEICKGTSVIGGNVLRIRNVSRSQIETPCSEQSTFAKPCNSGC
ncbi:MAG: hypothetical protein LC116_06615 [Bacteroidetes bacterium]|jgi:hypothetical protein|nr:hypothetical protein [Bacteroidota bacterium]